ncbi:hypothetical protein MO867_13515 [Microbulbifer sp. OS29]|uniref:Uncharacterized protein n=1 Tax=Microbulbifer okhotskensis TaxID=2926617 RepID=A0A9X2EPB5_9GAMM|nr:hypothetical protein [Microbulbifer okhotskensis]MCO1335351.1 hypothetical protein [Microbulbifer okhotskensis]
MLDEKFFLGGGITMLVVAAWTAPKLYREKLSNLVLFVLTVALIALGSFWAALEAVDYVLEASLDKATLRRVQNSLELIAIPVMWWSYLAFFFLGNLILWEIAKYRLEDILESKS